MYLGIPLWEHLATVTRIRKELEAASLLSDDPHLEKTLSMALYCLHGLVRDMVRAERITEDEYDEAMARAAQTASGVDAEAATVFKQVLN